MALALVAEVCQSLYPFLMAQCIFRIS